MNEEWQPSGRTSVSSRWSPLSIRYTGRNVTMVTDFQMDSTLKIPTCNFPASACTMWYPFGATASVPSRFVIKSQPETLKRWITRRINLLSNERARLTKQSVLVGRRRKQNCIIRILLLKECAVYKLLFWEVRVRNLLVRIPRIFEKTF